MAKYQYGCSKVYFGTMDPVTGEMQDEVEVDVYAGTIQHNEGTPTKTSHFKQGDSRPKVVRYANADEDFVFQIMDMSAVSKQRWKGGTVTQVDGRSTWNKRKGKQLPVSAALRFELEDGSEIYVPNASCMAVFDNELNDEDIVTMTVTAEVLSSGLDDVADFQWADAED